MATIQELSDALVKADAAGNVDDAKALANEIRRMQSAAPAAAPSGEGMPAGPRSAGLFGRLTASPQRVTPADILRAKQEEEIGAPGITPGVNPRAVAYPMLQMAGAAAGSAVGGIPGAAVGYAIPTQLERYTGENAPKTLKEAGVAAAEDVGTGLLTDIGGRAIGAGISGVVKGAAKLAGKSTAQTVEQLKTAETNAWNNVKKSTATFSDPIPLQDNVDSLLSPANYNYDPETFGAVKPVLKKLDGLYESALSGKPMSIHELRTVRTMLQDVENSGAKPAEKSLSKAIKDEVDSYVMAHGGQDGQAWADARNISNQLFRSRDIQNLVETANSKEIRDKFSDLMNSNAIKTYTPEQQQLIQQIANGSATEKGLEMVSALAPKHLGWQKIAGLLGLSHLVGGTPGTVGALAAYGTGAAARATANALARSRVNALDELIRGGQLAPPVDLSFLRPAATAGAIFATQPSQNALAPQQ